MDAKENARGLGGRECDEATKEETGMTTRKEHGTAATEPSEPSLAVTGCRQPKPRADDLAPYIRVGLQLIPLHRWDAVDGRGRPRGKTPRDARWTLVDYDSRAVAESVARTGINAGVRLPADVVVVDVDPRNFGGAEDPDNTRGRDALADLVREARLDLTVAPHTVTGSGGHHYWFRKPADASVVDSLEDFPGVEFKSAGRQVVAAGSVHPGGQKVVDPSRADHYRWDDLAPDLADMPDLPASLLALIRRPTRAHGDAAGGGELTPEMLASTLEHLDAGDFRDHDAWRDLMMACHHATAGEGRQEFVDWSTSDPAYADHAWIVGRRWDSLHMSPGGGRRGRPVTVKYLHKVVQEAGAEVARTEPEDDFEEWEEEEDLGAGVDDDVLRAPPKVSGLDSIVEEMNVRHYVVLDSGFQIITEEPDPIFDGRTRYQRLSKTDFCSAYENQLVEKGDKLMSKAKLWLTSAQRRQYKGIIFDPAREHEGWLNMWKGWTVDPRPGDWSLLRELIREVLTDGDEYSFEYVLNWMAFMFQHPSKVAEVAIAFRGAKGTGKGTLGRALFKLTGASGLHISSPSHLIGRFNSHLQNCVCLFADEAFWAGDKAGEAVLKQLVTEPTLTYEGKGRDAVTGRNHVHIVMASNNDWVVPAGMDGERRFAVFNVNERRRGDREFFLALNRQLDDGGLAGLLHDMLERDIRDWHPRYSVPQTEALTEQILMSQGPEESWWDGLLEGGRLPGLLSELPWHERAVEVDSDGLHEDYVAYAKNLGHRPKNKKGFAMKIKTKAGIGSRQVVDGGHKVWRWVLPRLEEARAVWQKSVGGN